MWWKNAIFYELYVDKFSRDFRSLIGRIGYLKDLGVDAVWVLPHYPSPMDDDGYDVSDFQNVRHELGTLDDFDLFVERAHAQNIKVVVDFVIGHTSTSHPWFVDAASSIESQYRDYYLWSNDGNQLRNSTNAFPNIKPNNWIFNPQTNDYYYATFYPSQADLNWDNEQVFSDMLANMEFWIERGVDGFRVDAVSTMIKREGTESYNLPEVHEIVKKIRKIFDDRFPDVLLLCEASGEQGEIEDYVKTGDEFHMAFNFALSRSIFLSLASGDMKYYEQALSSSIH
ncbi:trehalose synthase, partial [candidate division WWE3 bacterium]|nr:trehalose synthase [candidate division WWE3 bacterium]